MTSRRTTRKGLFRYIAIVIAVGLAVLGIYIGTGEKAFASTPESPSGEALPTVLPSGYHQVLADDFSESTLDNSRWLPYTGAATAPNTWSSANATVSGSALNLVAKNTGGTPDTWSEGAVSDKIALKQTYGEYKVRINMAPGDGVTSDLLLWPSDGNWKEGYIDFGQSQAGNRTTLSSYYQPAGGGAGVVSTTPANLSGWQTLGVAWSPGQVQFLLNGAVWKTFTGSTVPSTALTLEMKTQAFNCTKTDGTCVDATTPASVTTSIDWVIIYAPGAPVADSSPAPVAAPSLPGGVAMPTTNPPGWNEVFSDNFATAGLDTKKWSPYSGSLSDDPTQMWDPSHDVVAGNNELNIRAYQDPNHGGAWVTGGLSSGPGLIQTYGKYLVRFRMDAGNIPFVALLWPASNTGTHEVDFAEDFGGARQEVFATVHDSGVQTQHTISVDMTQWHTLGVEWLPGSITYTLDGQAWATVTGSAVPSVPMVLDLQTTVWGCNNAFGESCPTAATTEADMQVAWVVAYAPTS